MDVSNLSSQSVGERGPMDLRDNFLRMSICFAVGHGAATAPLVYASSSFDAKVAYVGNSALYIVTVLSALVFATPVVGMVGLRGGMTVALGLYALYVTGFTIAGLATAPFLQGVFFIGGSICGGLGAGILWTAEGGYMARSAAVISEEGTESRELVNSELATTFAFYYLACEVVAKILWSCLMYAGISVQVTGMLYALLSVASTCAMSSVRDLKPQPHQEHASGKLLGAVVLWSDVRIWLLSPTNITFGISAAYMNGLFNAEVATVLGAQYIGWLSAFTVFVSVAGTKLCAFLGPRFGNIAGISLGAASFAGIPLLFIMAHCCQDWGWWVCVFYALQGLGRAVYESTNKAVFADTFKGEQAEGAFANCLLQSSLASSICFFMSAVVAAHQLQMAVLIFAMITPVAYIASTYLDASAPPEAGPLLEKAV